MDQSSLAKLKSSDNVKIEITLYVIYCSRNKDLGIEYPGKL